MSDQDFFFDDEDEGPKKPAGKSGSTEPKKAPSSKAASPRSSSAKRPPAAAVDAGPTPFFDRDVTMAVASLLAVIGLLVGVIAGYLLAGALTSPTVNVPAATSGTGVAPGAGTAPSALTPEQLNSGQLPAGHPQINSGGSGVTTPTK